VRSIPFAGRCRHPGLLTDRELIEAMRRARDDDAPRLVLADVLLERGDPRGELIALQCELARGRLPRERALRLRRREHGLLEKWGKSWARLDGIAEAWTFRRGFVEEITVDAKALLERQEEVLDKAPLLRAVRLKGLHVGLDVDDPTFDQAAMMGRIERVVDLPGIDTLDVVDAAVSWEHEGAMSTYEVSARADDAIASNLSRSGRLRGLVGLTLTGAHASTIRTLTTSPDVGALETLVLRGTFGPVHGWNDDAREALGTVATLLRPRRLELRDDSIHPIDDQLDALADHALFARVVDLSVGRFVRSSALTFAGRGILPRLRRLCCETDMTREEWSVLVDSPELSRLEELRVSVSLYAARKKVDLTPLLGETKLEGLRVLAVRQHVVTPDLAKALVKSPLAARLEVLDLRGNHGLEPIRSYLRDNWDGILLL
jgi:uncharacterized protein (TIGR02996 family)